MDIEQLRDYCLSKADVTECFPFDAETIVFKVNNKMFLLSNIHQTPIQFNVKCDPEKAIELREEYPMAVMGGYHMNKKHWNTIIDNGDLSHEQLVEQIDHSYLLVAPKPKKTVKTVPMTE